MNFDKLFIAVAWSPFWIERNHLNSDNHNRRFAADSSTVSATKKATDLIHIAVDFLLPPSHNLSSVANRLSSNLQNIFIEIN
jgi:hypothetical protein